MKLKFRQNLQSLKSRYAHSFEYCNTKILTISSAGLKHLPLQLLKYI